MAACGSLHTILYDNPLPQNPPSILDSLSSWKLLESVKHTIENPCYTEIYSDIHLKEKEKENENATPPTPLSSASSGEMVPPPAEAVAVAVAASSIESVDKEKNEKIYESSSGHRKQYKHSDSFSSQNSETLSLCTESLGFESSDDVLEDLRNENCFFDAHINEDNRSSRHSPIYTRRSRTTTTCKGPFPPPISCIGKTGKPWVYFQTYRQDGRFILQEVRIPTQEFLHSCREDGRLRMQLIQSDEEGDYDDDDDDDDDDFGTVEE